MIRLACYNDLKGIMEVINDAKALFKSEGSDQWQDLDNYPNELTMSKDIENNELYVNIKDNKIVGCIVLSTIHEKAYDFIYDGNWQTGDNYSVIHRIAVKNGYYKQGVAKEMIEFVIELSRKMNLDSIKVDTKLTNERMVGLLLHFGFKIVGKIDLLRKDVIDKVRIALEKVL